mgnify:FL=1
MSKSAAEWIDQPVATLTTEGMSEADWDAFSDEQLNVMERKIAGKYMHVFPWIAVVWGVGNCLVWLSLWPLFLCG